MVLVTDRRNSRVGRVRGGGVVAPQTTPVQQLAGLCLQLVQEDMRVVMTHKQKGNKSPKLELLAVMPETHLRTVEDRIADMHAFGSAVIEIVPEARRAVEVIAQFQAIGMTVLVTGTPKRADVVQPSEITISPGDTSAKIAAAIREIGPDLYRLVLICTY